MLRSLRRPLAAAGLAATVAAVPYATLAALAEARVITVPLAALSWLVVVVYVVKAPKLWPALTTRRARLTMVAGMIAAFLGLLVGFWVNVGVSIDHDLCGNTAAPQIIGVVVYVAAAAFAIHTSRRAAPLWFLAALLGWGVEIGLLFVLPGTHGYCET